MANGAAATVLATALNGLPGPVQETVTSGAAKLSEQLSAGGPRTIGETRTLAAHLSAANPDVNRALTLMSAALAELATPSISPLDQTALQLSQALSALAEPAPAPSS